MLDLVRQKYAAREMEETRLIQPPVFVHEPPNPGFNITSLTLITLLYSMSIALIVYGAVHINDCPAQKMIGISMIVLGGLSLLTRFLNGPYDYRSIRGAEGDEIPKSGSLICLNFICQLVFLCFFYALCYWILTIEPDTKPGDEHMPNYCELQLYRNTYWGCIAGLVLSGLVFVGSCCAVCILACCV